MGDFGVVGAEVGGLVRQGGPWSCLSFFGSLKKKSFVFFVVLILLVFGRFLVFSFLFVLLIAFCYLQIVVILKEVWNFYDLIIIIRFVVVVIVVGVVVVVRVGLG